MKSLYLYNALTDFDEIWNGDATQFSGRCQPIKYKKFKNPRRQWPTSWKIEKKTRYPTNHWTDIDEI